MFSGDIAKVGAVLGLACIVGSGAACTVTAESSPATGATGALEVSWTVASTTDPNMCAMYGATNLVIALTDSAGSSLGTWSAACTAFALTVPSLTPGTVTLTGSMVDGTNQAVTTTVGPASVAIVAGTTATASLNFSAASFIGQTGSGTLNLSWTIASQSDPASCTSHNVDSIHFRLEDTSGNLVGAELMQTCSAFATTASYPAGAYTMSSELFIGSTVRTTSATTPVTITSGATTQQTVDFPETSFIAQ